MKITPQQARQFLLAHQSLWPPYQQYGKAGILAFLRRVNCIQYDPLNIVGQNPDLVLQARLDDYHPALLRELLYQDRRLVDGWDKNMSIYPVEDWPYFERRRLAARNGNGNSHEAVRTVLPEVRAELERRGPLSSIDLDLPQRVDWPWGPTRLGRAAMESMYWWGELVVHHKVNTRRVYDFAHRLLPAELLATPDPNLQEDDYHDWYVLRRIGSIGLLGSRSGDGWLGMTFLKSPQRQAAIRRLLERGLLLEVQVEGEELPLYMRSADQPALDYILQAPSHEAQAAILAPLDNLLWDRRLVKELFTFDYKWEVYKPVAERRHGYYVLPVLYGDRFIARFEPGCERRGKTLVIKNWWWEPEVSLTDEIIHALRQCFRRFARYLGVERIQADAALASFLPDLLSKS